jgi:glycosyltransferase involved in cell wall biosynthesis
MSDVRFCVLIPAYREQARVGEVVTSVLKYCRDVIVIDDGSDDRTGEVAKKAGALVLTQPRNMGKGAAIQRGVEHARANGFECGLIMDGDGQHDPADIPGFLAAYDRDSAPVVVGNRMADPRGMPLVRRLTNMFMSRLLSKRMRQRVPDTQCGFRLVRCDLMPPPSPGSERFAGESESLIRMSAAGVRIASAPVKVIYRDEKSKISPVKDTIRFFAMLRRMKQFPSGN